MTRSHKLSTSSALSFDFRQKREMTDNMEMSGDTHEERNENFVLRITITTKSIASLRKIYCIILIGAGINLQD